MPDLIFYARPCLVLVDGKVPALELKDLPAPEKSSRVLQSTWEQRTVMLDVNGADYIDVEYLFRCGAASLSASAWEPEAAMATVTGGVMTKPVPLKLGGLSGFTTPGKLERAALCATIEHPTFDQFCFYVRETGGVEHFGEIMFRVHFRHEKKKA